MIVTITVCKTTDGQIFESYSEAEQHERTLNLHHYVEQMKELAEIQRKDKRRLPKLEQDTKYDSSLKWKAGDLQRKIKEQSNNLRCMLIDLESKKG
jgi:hypothetical protein